MEDLDALGAAASFVASAGVEEDGDPLARFQAGYARRHAVPLCIALSILPTLLTLWMLGAGTRRRYREGANGIPAAGPYPR